VTRGRQIRIAIGAQVLTGTLEEERAPATCAAFVALLPLRAKILQARWSGQALWVPLDGLDEAIGAENELHRPLPGQLLFYPGGDSPPEILMPYGVTAFAAKCGPLSGNHFLTVDTRVSPVEELGHRVWWEGAQDIVFD
jgi:hypothetical protein